jgi:signal transduction histidine kinase/AmiR/NasT family two-component response regulator
MLAIIGSMGFAIYLLVVFLIALQNEERLQNIVQVKQPVIEHLRISEVAIEGFRASLTNAISLEDPFLIEDAQGHAKSIETHLSALTQLDPVSGREISVLLKKFHEHTQHAVSISSQLVQDPGKIYDLQADVEAMTKRQNEIAADLSAFMDRNLKDYASDLQKAGAAMRETRHWGVILGLLTIALLMTLAITISIQARNAITRSDRLKDEFLSTISHELRTPMNGILGAISLLRGTDLNASQQQLLDAANASSSEMLLAVTDILAFSDFLTGNVYVKARDFTMDGLMNDVISRAHSECQPKQLNLNVNIARLPYIYHGDTNHVAHVLRHVLSNAVKFTEKGNIWLDVEVEQENQANGECQMVFRIRDSGNGVPENLIEEIFEPFRQVDGSFSRKFGGLGIGLSICKHITSALKGSIRFCNHQEGGAVVTITIPLRYRVQPETVDVAVNAAAPTSEAGTAAPAGTALEPLTSPVATSASAPVTEPAKTASPAEDNKLDLFVLVVEDNKVNQMVINGYLKKMGCTVATANNGLEGVDKAREQHFDLILMDCQMPVMDGFEATQQIRLMPHHDASVLPIIAVTANAMEGDRERCLASGMSDYLSKPVDIHSLRDAIERNMAEIAQTQPSQRAVG